MDSLESRHSLRLLGSLLLAAACLPLVTAATPRTAIPEAVAPAVTPAPAPIAPSARASRPAKSAPAGELTPAAAHVLFAMSHRTADASNAAALFAPRSWYTPPPAPPPVAAPAPSAPTAPALPFAFLGRYTDGNDATVYFVTRDDRVYDVKPGDSIDTIYSVEAVENGQLIFLYKPLNTRQPLALGDAP